MSAMLSNKNSKSFDSAFGARKHLPHLSGRDGSPGHNVYGSGKLRLLVLDQNRSVRKACCEIAENGQFIAIQAENVKIARQILDRKDTDILLLDVTHPESGGQLLLEQMKVLYPEILVIAMSADATISSAVDAMRIGACDYLSKPCPLNVMVDALDRAARRWQFAEERRRLQQELRNASGLSDSLGQSIEMEKLYRILSNVADSKHPVMILGENGTGKTLVAHSIHSNGPQSEKPFVSLDCASMGPDLVENTLFGYSKDFVDKADAQKRGLLASTIGGTVFLDEVDTLPLDLQAKLLAALRDKEVRLPDSGRAVQISVRILAATSRDLTQMVREGLFRMDLYRLLSVVNLRIPPLRGRPDDIAFLAKRFLENVRCQTGSTCVLSDETLEMLETYDWPENVQELESTIAGACAQSLGSELKPIHLPLKLIRFHKNRKTRPVQVSCFNEDLNESASKQSVVPIAKLEKRAILEAMRETSGDKSKAAALLGIGKTTLYRKLKEYGVSDESDATSSLSSIDDATDPASAPFCT